MSDAEAPVKAQLASNFSISGREAVESVQTAEERKRLREILVAYGVCGFDYYDLGGEG